MWSFWRHRRETSWMRQVHSVTYPATAKIVAWKVAEAVAESRIIYKFYFSCHLSRNDFGRFRVCYTTQCLVQLASQRCRQNVARLLARNLLQYNSACTMLLWACVLEIHVHWSLSYIYIYELLILRMGTWNNCRICTWKFLINIIIRWIFSPIFIGWEPTTLPA